MDTKEALAAKWFELLPKLQAFVKGFERGPDLLQDAFVFLWETIHDDWKPYEGQSVEDGLRHLVYGAVWYARLHEQDRLESERHWLEIDKAEDLVPPNHYDPFEELAQWERDVVDEERRQHLLGLVRLALAHMDARVQEVFELVYFQGKSWKETARLTGKSLGYTRSTLRTGRNRIRAWLNEHIACLP